MGPQAGLTQYDVSNDWLGRFGRFQGEPGCLVHFLPRLSRRSRNAKPETRSCTRKQLMNGPMGSFIARNGSRDSQLALIGGISTCEISSRSSARSLLSRTAIVRHSILS